MDDGPLSISSWGSPTIQLHTEGFSEAEQLVLSQWLLDRGYEAKIQKFTRKSTGKQYQLLRLNAKTSRRWISDFKQFSIPSMDYKFRDR